MSLSGKLGVLPPFRFMFDGPWWAGALWFLLLTHVIPILVINAGIEKRWLPPRDTWYSWFYGDLPLALGFSALLYTGRYLPERQVLPGWVHVVVLLMIGVFFWRWITEYAYYTPKQWASPSSIYHTCLYVAIGYPLFVWAMAWLQPSMLGFRPIHWVGVSFALVMVFVWIGLGIYDGKRPDREVAIASAHPKDFEWPVSRFVEKYLDDVLTKLSGKNKQAA